MRTVNRVLSIRISGKERKQKVRKLLLDLAHFKNLLVLFICKYKELYGEFPLNISLLNGLVAKQYTGKYQNEFFKLLENIKSDEELLKLFQNLKAQKEKIQNAPLVQNVIRSVVKDFNNYLKSLKAYKQNPKKFKAKPNPPKPKKLRYIMDFSVEGNRNIFKLQENKLLIKLRNGKYLKVKLPKDFNYEITSFRLKLLANDLYVNVVYKYPLHKKEPKGRYRAGIDVGLDELLSVVSENPSLKSFIVSGKELKAFNQWFNKERAKLRSQIDFLKNEIESGDYENTKRLEKKLKELELKEKELSAHRRRKLNNDLHKIARKVVEILYETGHRVIYIGKNALESKNGINLGKKINQEFVSIPFRKLIELIKYKAQELGIQVIEVDESYTSKTSPLANIFEVRKRKDKGLCKGEKKGNLFKDKVLSKVFHADLVGALNILRVGAKLLRLRSYEDLKLFFIKLCNPKRFKLMEFFYEVSTESLHIAGIGGSKREKGAPAGVDGGRIKNYEITVKFFLRS